MDSKEIIIFSDGKHELDDIIAQIGSRGFSYEVVSGKADQQEILTNDASHVILLVFQDIEEIKSFILSVEPEARNRNKLIALCSVSEAKIAVRLVVDGAIDDYYVFQPIYDINRLYACIHHAFDRPNFRRTEEISDKAKSAAPAKNSVNAPKEKKELESSSSDDEDNSTYSVLIVDDDPIVLKLMSAILKRNGYMVYHARNGKEAVVSASKLTPNLILMDIMMPDIDGIRLTQRLKKHQELGTIPIIIMTEHASKENVRRSLNSGAVDFLVKPINRDLLLNKVKQHRN